MLQTVSCFYRSTHEDPQNTNTVGDVILATAAAEVHVAHPPHSGPFVRCQLVLVVGLETRQREDLKGQHPLSLTNTTHTKGHTPVLDGF